MRFAPFVYKETLHVIRDWRMLLVVIMIPIVLMVLFGFAISTEINNINVAVAYQKYDNATRRHIDRMVANPYVTVKGYVSPDDVHDELRRGAVNAVVVFKDGANAQIVTDGSNPNVAQSDIAYLTAILQGESAARNSLIDTRFLYNPQLQSSYNFVPGIMGMLFMLVCALMTAVSIVREKETGTMELILVSPTRPMSLVVAKMVPFFILSCVDLTIILLIAKYMLGVPMTSGVGAIILLTLIYIALSLLIGLFVSTVADSQVTAMLVCGLVMIFPVVMLSGMLFPVENLPIILKQISAIVPARWYIDAMRKLMIEGLPLRAVIDDMVILIGITLFLLVVSVAKFKDRLQ